MPFGPGGANDLIARAAAEAVRDLLVHRRDEQLTVKSGRADGVAMRAAGSASAKSLVYCSEGSPENFTPAMNTTGTSLDAARPVFNKLVQFTPGTTQMSEGIDRKSVV